MAISLTEVKNRLRPYILFHWNEETLGLLDDTDFLNVFNDVADDLNTQAQINLERWYAKTGSTHAEDSDYTNYVMAGDVEKVFFFGYDSDDWEDQYYSYVDDRIVLKVSPAADIQMDVRYLRKCEPLTDPTDEVDLPEEVLSDYVELLKVRLLIDFSEKVPNMTYQEALMLYGEKAKGRMKRHVINSVPVQRYWFRQSDDSTKKLNDQHYISMDNFVSDVSGNYSYIS